VDGWGGAVRGWVVVGGGGGVGWWVLMLHVIDRVHGPIYYYAINQFILGSTQGLKNTCPRAGPALLFI